MKTERSEVHVPETTEQIQYNCTLGDLGSSPHPSDSNIANYLPLEDVSIPGYVAEVEEHTPNSGGGRRAGWKSYEHYLCRRTAHTGGGIQAPTYKSAPPGGAHTAVAYVSNNRFGTTTVPAHVADSPFGEPGFPIAGLPAYYVKREDDGFIPAPSNLAALEGFALSAVLPGIKAELSAINSLIELKDFKSLPKTLSKVNRYVAETSRRAKGSLREFFQGSADGYLQAKFNILPLLSDISGVHSALSSAERRINALVAGAGKPRLRHYEKSLQEHTYSPFEETSDGYLPHEGSTVISGYYLTRKVYPEPSIFHVEIQYNYLFSEYQIVHAQLLGMLDFFGVNLNPAIIWNALPWSFVVDWVIGVGRWLDQLKVRNLEPRINIRRYCWSIKRERRVHTYRNLFGLYGPSFPVKGVVIPCPVTLERAYRREVKSPSISSIASSGLSPNEISLGAALVIGRRRKNRNRVREF